MDLGSRKLHFIDFIFEQQHFRCLESGKGKACQKIQSGVAVLRRSSTYKGILCLDLCTEMLKNYRTQQKRYTQECCFYSR